MRQVHDAFDAWRQADAAARVIESQVRAAAVNALEGTGEPPDDELRRRARELRRDADALLRQALEVMSPGRRERRTGPIDEADGGSQDAHADEPRSRQTPPAGVRGSGRTQ